MSRCMAQCVHRGGNMHGLRYLITKRWKDAWITLLNNKSICWKINYDTPVLEEVGGVDFIDKIFSPNSIHLFAERARN